MSQKSPNPDQKTASKKRYTLNSSKLYQAVLTSTYQIYSLRLQAQSYHTPLGESSRVTQFSYRIIRVLVHYHS